MRCACRSFRVTGLSVVIAALTPVASAQEWGDDILAPTCTPQDWAACLDLWSTGLLDDLQISVLQDQLSLEIPQAQVSWQPVAELGALQLETLSSDWSFQVAAIDLARAIDAVDPIYKTALITGLGTSQAEAEQKYGAAYDLVIAGGTGNAAADALLYGASLLGFAPLIASFQIPADLHVGTLHAHSLGAMISGSAIASGWMQASDPHFLGAPGARWGVGYPGHVWNGSTDPVPWLPGSSWGEPTQVASLQGPANGWFPLQQPKGHDLGSVYLRQLPPPLPPPVQPIDMWTMNGHLVGSAEVYATRHSFDMTITSTLTSRFDGTLTISQWDMQDQARLWREQQSLMSAGQFDTKWNSSSQALFQGFSGSQ